MSSQRQSAHWIGFLRVLLMNTVIPICIAQRKQGSFVDDGNSGILTAKTMYHILQGPPAASVASPAGGVPRDPADVRGHGTAQRPHHCQRPHRSPGDAPRLPHHTGGLAGQRHRPLTPRGGGGPITSTFSPHQHLHLDLCLLIAHWLLDYHTHGGNEGQETKAASSTASYEKSGLWMKYYYHTSALKDSF